MRFGKLQPGKRSLLVLTVSAAITAALLVLEDIANWPWTVLTGPVSLIAIHCFHGFHSWLANPLFFMLSICYFYVCLIMVARFYRKGKRYFLTLILLMLLMSVIAYYAGTASVRFLTAPGGS
jgi:hypothetical protein